MSLTGTAFLDLIVATAVLAFTGLVLLWPRLSGRRPHVVLARAGLLATVNVLVLLTAATQLNAQYLFFTNWADLTGTTGGHVSVTAIGRGGAAVQATRQIVHGTATTAATTLPPPLTGLDASTVHTYTVRGPLSGVTGQITVELPPGYTSAADGAVRYPVLETFGGYPGSPGQWIRTMKLGTAIASGVAAHQIRSAMIVSPQVEIPLGTDTECVNGGPGDPQLETWLARDVPDWVAHTFRVSTARSSWATIGFSAGAWCAAMATMLHPAQYSAAVVMGGYFHPDFGPFYEPFTHQDPAVRRYDLVALAKKNPPPVAMWLETSHADPLSYSSSAGLLRSVRAPMSVQAMVLQHAGHRLSVWQGEVPSVVSWLGSTIPGFAPTG